MKKNITRTAAIIIAILIVTALMQGIRATKAVVLVKVTDKERVEKGKESKYLVFTDRETFECTDALLFWKFDSSDMYGAIQIGKTYRLTVYGWRIPFASSYRNIIKVESK